MRRRALALLSALLAGLSMAGPAGAYDPWVVYYENKLPASALTGYKLAVLDADRHPDLAVLRRAKVTTLGYLSLGEVEDHRAHYEAVRDEGILLAENEIWKGSFFVDLRDPRWTRRVVEELIPAILAKGFDGVFYDTLDNAEVMESMDPVAHRGMVKGGVALLKAIRARFPKAVLMMNRGYALLPDGVGEIDLLLGESVYGSYDFDAKKYVRASDQDYLWQVTKLRQARQANPALKIMTIDYWEPGDTAGVARIYALQRRNGFHPYVSTIELDRVFPEPKP